MRARTSTVSRHGVFDVLRHEMIDGAGEPMARPYFTFSCPDWVSVVPVRPDGRFVLVRQYRHGIDDFTVETPGGVVDEGESPEAAARRELAEETGYTTTAELVLLGSTYPNPVLQNNRHHMFLALEAEPTRAPDFDEGEHCELLLARPDELRRMLESGDIAHALVALAVSRALDWLSRASAPNDAAPAPNDAAPRIAAPPVELAKPKAVVELATIDDLLGHVARLVELQGQKVIDLARRLNPRLTAEDLRNPHDFPELDDPDWHFEDGQLVALESIVTILRARRAKVADGSERARNERGESGREDEERGRGPSGA